LAAVGKVVMFSLHGGVSPDFLPTASHDGIDSTVPKRAVEQVTQDDGSELNQRMSFLLISFSLESIVLIVFCLI
jgi:hypothetical protein